MKNHECAPGMVAMTLADQHARYAQIRAAAIRKGAQATLIGMQRGPHQWRTPVEAAQWLCNGWDELAQTAVGWGADARNDAAAQAESLADVAEIYGGSILPISRQVVTVLGQSGPGVAASRLQAQIAGDLAKLKALLGDRRQASAPPHTLVRSAVLLALGSADHVAQAMERLGGAWRLAATATKRKTAAARSLLDTDVADDWLTAQQKAARADEEIAALTLPTTTATRQAHRLIRAKYNGLAQQACRMQQGKLKASVSQVDSGV
jgi:hypothetical protein